MKQYLFLSPHLDDVILSCGMYIHKLIQNNSKVIIATVFSGSIEPQYLSPLAKWFHSTCKLGNNAMMVRRLEDKNASKFVKADSIHLNLHECLYRRNANGSPRYLRESNIYNANLNKEKDTINKVNLVLKDKFKLNNFERIYIPLGIGRHIDHLILRKAVETLCTQVDKNIKKINYYEDIPYACSNRDVNWKTELTKGLNYYSYNINEEEFNIYIKAISLYKSQIHMLWSNNIEMRKQLKNYFMDSKSKMLKSRVWEKTFF
ncbi:PIG-L family deacetylase [Clostridium sp. OS1-26]|uniref:PIG-L family deacetylase n=1 Tax=Clostridium sp. OS1-26 TaxID=3070681 RepID=UPI0027DF94B1|nr:PIG-L family deacetylase [Clostridium sp. OS1-26]WML35844.1 PIG-L family deacetylase [Clostridium sp. OS1-26]